VIKHLAGERLIGTETERLALSTGEAGGIIAHGGGGGTVYNVRPQGFPGGSGGGSGNDSTGGAGNTGGYSPVEGYAGGNGSNSSGGGGGGASEAGGNAENWQQGGDAGDGGDGATNSILTGSNITYAGGGGAGVNTSSQPVGDGGTGGGGDAGTHASADGDDGTDGLGGGGGAAGNSSYTGGDGGSGVVIIRFITSGNGYSQAGGTVTTVGAETVIQWTATSGTRTFTPTGSFDVEYLVVAGGGGAGNANAGGGGAGGYRTNYGGTALGVTAQAYTITVGDGGAGGASGAGNRGADGENSVISILGYIPPNFTNGTILEESDTGKFYMFDGTSAWNEVT
jgi:hypothetical protein